MGRIAEALKKAQRDRDEKLRLGLGDAVLPDTRRAVPGSVSCPPIEPDPVVGVVGRGPRPAVVAEPSAPGFRNILQSRRPGLRLDPMPTWHAHPSVVALRDRDTSITEQYRAIRTWLLRRPAAGEHTCLAITSSVPQEGKSVTVANLAVVLAEVRHLNILAIDCDFRQGYLSTLFKMPNSPGLADVLVGRATAEESIAETPLGNLSVLPAGTCQDLNPAELINSTAASRLFEELRERFHFILVDTPPVQWLSDIGVIGALCTGVMMVVRMNKTPASAVRQSVSWLRSNNLNVIGCIAAACSLDAAGSGYREPEKED